MNQRTRTNLYFAATFTTLIGVAAIPAAYGEDIAAEAIPSKPGVTELIGRILADPHRDYASVQGPDDCNSEEMFLGTKAALGQYVSNPLGEGSALRDYILSGKAECNCTRAVVGKDIDILVEDVGLSMSDLPCL